MNIGKAAAPSEIIIEMTPVASSELITAINNHTNRREGIGELFIPQVTRLDQRAEMRVALIKLNT